jgi:hypothetical protein
MGVNGMSNKKENNNFFESQQKLKAEMSNYMTKDEFMEMMKNLRFTHISSASITLISSVLYNVDSAEVEIKTYNINVMKR